MEIEDKVEEKLKEIFGYINDWLKFAEAKNAAILTLGMGTLFGLSSYAEKTNKWIYIVLIIILLLSVMSSLLSFYPNLSNSKIKIITGLFTWIAKFWEKENHSTKEIKIFYSDISEKYSVDGTKELNYLENIYKDYYDSDKSDEFNQLEIDYAKEIIINSKITVNKYVFFKASLKLFILFLVLFSLSIGYQKINEKEDNSNKIIIIEKLGGK